MLKGEQEGRKVRPKHSVNATDNQSSGPRITLNTQQAAEIYRCKLEILQNATSMQEPSSSLQGQSTRIGFMFDVSPKTIRDVWNRRTWQGATCHLWNVEDSSGFGQRTVREGERNRVQLEVQE
jgi:hypothetical protein